MIIQYTHTHTHTHTHEAGDLALVRAATPPSALSNLLDTVAGRHVYTYYVI